MRGSFEKESQNGIGRRIRSLLGRAAEPQIDRAKIRAAAGRFLDSRHFSLFADYDISNQDRKAEAAEWLTDQVTAVLDRIEY